MKRLKLGMYKCVYMLCVTLCIKSMYAYDGFILYISLTIYRNYINRNIGNLYFLLNTFQENFEYRKSNAVYKMSINGSKSSFGSKNSVNQKKKEDVIHKDESKWSAERPKPVKKFTLNI